jgi:hypothetical protein
VQGPATTVQKVAAFQHLLGAELGEPAMLITCHWSASNPQPISDYHVEFALVRPIPGDIAAKLASGSELSSSDVDRLVKAFDIWKFMSFDEIPRYATWHVNHDPRDGQTANVSMAALCMGGEGVQTTGPWGRWPFTTGHAYMMSALAARVCQLKGLDPTGSFDASLCTYSPQMNGPIQNIATHGERAFQTPNPGVAHPERGYFIYSGDPDCRWDLAALRVDDAGKLGTFESAIACAHASGDWLRQHAKKLVQAGISDFWSLDKDPVPVP